MEKKTLVAVYEDIVHATNVVAKLQESDVRRADIGLAVRQPSETNKEPSQALVTATAPMDRLAQILDVMEHHEPIKLDIRDTQWRLTDEPPFEPSEDTFVALDLAKIRSSASGRQE